MYKFFCVIAFLAVAQAQLEKTEEYDPNPSYSFSYDIEDPVSGDVKSQAESRDGDVVQGSYSLVEPDGSKRIVEYTADPINGFNAAVRKEIAGGLAKSAPVKPIVLAKAARLPLTLAKAPLAYAPAPLAYAPAPLAYAPAPLAYARSPLTYAPGHITLAHAPAPLALHHAPLAAPAVVRSSLSSPYYSYSL